MNMRYRMFVAQVFLNNKYYPRVSKRRSDEEVFLVNGNGVTRWRD